MKGGDIMYDDKETEIRDKAVALLTGIRRALANGVKHYRLSDNKLLTTEKEIIETLLEHGQVIIL